MVRHKLSYLFLELHAVCSRLPKYNFGSMLQQRFLLSQLCAICVFYEIIDTIVSSSESCIIFRKVILSKDFCGIYLSICLR